MFLCFVPGRGSSRPWAWWGWLDGWAYLWAISAPLAVPAPSTRASGLGERPRPAAVGRGAPQVWPKTREWRTTPAATKKRSAAFPLGMANALRPGLGSNSSQPRKAGWIPQGGGRPLLWRFFGGFLIAEKATLRSKPRLASLYPAPRETPKFRPASVSLYCTKFPLTLSAGGGIMSITTKQKQTKRAGKGQGRPTEGVTLSGSPGHGVRTVRGCNSGEAQQ